MQASILFDIARRQMQAVQSFTSASLSGFERAQQAALSTCQHVVDRQLETAGRVSEQATSIALDPEQVRPAMAGFVDAQRDLVSAMSDMQRRYIEAITPDNAGREDATAAYFDTVRQSLDQWQRWTEQLLRAAREQTDRVASEVEQRGRELGQATSQAARSAASQMHEAGRKAEDAAARRAEPARGSPARTTADH